MSKKRKSNFRGKVGSDARRQKTALENLVKLHGQQYFAGPSVPRDLSKEWERHERQKSVDAGVGKKLQWRKA